MSSHADTIRATDDEWRTQPTDLGGWANRAAQMKATADALLAENQRWEDRAWNAERRKAAVEAENQRCEKALELARQRALLILDVTRQTHRPAEDRLSQIEGEAEHFYFVATGRTAREALAGDAECWWHIYLCSLALLILSGPALLGYAIWLLA